MNLDWSSLATLAATALSWAGIWTLRKRGVHFTFIALFALAIGVPIGLVAGTHVEAINPIGLIYINVLLATVAPLILVAIVTSILGLGALDKLRTIGLRSIFWLLLSNALAVVLALGLAFVFQPGKGIHRELGGLSTDAIQGQVQSFSQVVVGFFPVNVVQDFSANNIIPIIVIAVTLSVAYLSLAEKEPLKVKPFRDGAEALKLVVFKVVSYVIRLTPYAIVALTAHMVGSSTNLGADFKSLIGLLVLVWAACVIHAYVFNAVILEVFADVPMVAFFRKIFPAPLGATIGMPGCAGIWPIMIAVWGINAYGLSYTFADYAVLAILGVTVSIG